MADAHSSTLQSQRPYSRLLEPSHIDAQERCSLGSHCYWLQWGGELEAAVFLRLPYYLSFLWQIQAEFMIFGDLCSQRVRAHPCFHGHHAGRGRREEGKTSASALPASTGKGCSQLLLHGVLRASHMLALHAWLPRAGKEPQCLNAQVWEVEAADCILTLCQEAEGSCHVTRSLQIH